MIEKVGIKIRPVYSGYWSYVQTEELTILNPKPPDQPELFFANHRKEKEQRPDQSLLCLNALGGLIFVIVFEVTWSG